MNGGLPAASAAATRLNLSEIIAVRDRAHAAAGPFVNPAVLATVKSWWRPRLREWAEAILGRSVDDLTRLPWEAIYTLHLAREAEPDAPVGAREAAARARVQAAEAARQASFNAWDTARRTEWQSLAAALPTRVGLAYNYSGPHHYDGHQSGAVHIITDAAIHVGRLHRAAGTSLCWTPSRSRSLLFATDGLADAADQIPTCKQCIRTAHRITGLPDPTTAENGRIAS